MIQFLLRGVTCCVSVGSACGKVIAKKPLKSHTLSLSTRRNCFTGAYVLRGRERKSDYTHSIST